MENEKAAGELHEQIQKAEEGVDELKERLSEKEAEAAQYLDSLKRTQAEMENFRKRMLKEHERVVECAAEGVIGELIPLIDNLERALVVVKSGEEAQLVGGVELIYAQLKAVLEKQGVTIIDPVGEAFDPQVHQAVMQVESDEHEENQVVEVLQKGYSLKSKLLRAAMVKVAK